MSMMYGHKWTSAYGDLDDGTWGRVLGGLTGNQIAQGLERCVDRDDAWPPTAPEFRNLCLGRNIDAEKDMINNQQAINGKELPLLLTKKPTDEELAYGKEQGAKLRAMFK